MTSFMGLMRILVIRKIFSYIVINVNINLPNVKYDKTKIINIWKEMYINGKIRV